MLQSSTEEEENTLMLNNVITVSDVITINEAGKWGPGDCVTIQAGTGAGKSFFIKNDLYKLAEGDNKKILMLTPRLNCLDQFTSEMVSNGKTDIIDIKTYQSLEYKVKHFQEINLKDYRYIVCDEFHYFMSDAAFSISTDISLSLISKQPSATKIFMSATGDHMKKYLKEFEKIKTIDYEMPISYDFIEELSFFYTDDTFEKLIEEVIAKNEKAILFIRSARKAYNLFEKNKEHCLFNCAKSNKYYKHVDKVKIGNMLEKERFEESILITTTCLDTGVNIIDSDLRHVVCEVDDTDVLTQCIGRKRIRDNEKIHLYIKVINDQMLGWKKTKLKNKLKKAEYRIEHSNREYINKYSRQNDEDNIVYDKTVEEEDKGTKAINWLMYYKFKNDSDEIADIQRNGRYGYCNYIKSLFGIENYVIIEEEHKKNDLEHYLDEIIGIRLPEFKRSEIIEKIDLKDKRGRSQRSMPLLNAYFDENKLPYTIKADTDWDRKLDDGSRNPYYGKIYWMLYKLSSVA